MTQFFRGAKVEQLVTPIKGTVVGFAVDQESGDRQVKVEYTDSTGAAQERFFNEAELKFTPDPAEQTS